MNYIFINFLAGAVVSFLGSIPVGILNITIVHIALQKGLKPAFYFALSCALVELGYSYIAILLMKAVFNWQEQEIIFHIVSIMVLMGAGVYYLRKKPSQRKEQNMAKAFYQGLILSIINVVAIPFWLVYTTLLTTHAWVKLETGISIAGYILGISLGTLLSLLSFALFSHKINQRFMLEGVIVNRIIGLVLIATSVAQTIYVIK
jgi:threonine/homoserine/homoserine lactone efflux protein